MIEIKLRRNSEARRAVIGQILTYAAYLKGLSVPALEEILRRHLDKAEASSVLDLVRGSEQSAEVEADRSGQHSPQSFRGAAAALTDAYRDAVKGQAAWNGHDFYVSFGENEQRSWDEAVDFGFVSAGGGEWYTKTLRQIRRSPSGWCRWLGSQPAHARMPSGTRTSSPTRTRRSSSPTATRWSDWRASSASSVWPPAST